MEIKELNSILVYCKVNNIYEIQYVEYSGRVSSELQNTMELYCFKYNKYIPVKNIIKTAKEHGYNKDLG